ncbi:hypothetical protein KDA08_04805, partial [Candidatus Saccharibacteria bacterium]|nr:hypothetical protein [Candidatus Saccharibacteria bacterium]
PSPSEGDKPWGNYQPFPNYPTDYAMPYMETADLSNNGKTDIFFFNTTYNQTNGERRVFTAKYPSLGKDGFAKLQEVPERSENEISLATDFPLIKRGYKQEYVGFNNIIGDGMPHRIKVGRDTQNNKLIIEYWPSLGYGYFGEKITLDTEQLISSDTNFIRDFDIARLFFADIDGSGTIDLIYAHANHADVYINQNGNSFADPISVDLPIHYSNIDQISFADILGNGTSCMVITKISPKVTHYYYNFIGKNDEDEKVIKPYLLNEINNNLGSITQLSYSSSTQFYLADKQNNRPWITTLAFPVQVVEKVTHINLLTNARFTSSYAYHDGYYDFIEREFRGFAFVEQWDSEEYTDFAKNSAAGEHDYQTLAEQYYVPPTYTKSWYHTGLALAGDILQFFKDQYYQGDTNSYDFPNDYLDPQIITAGGLTQEQAYTALQGKVIRSELYFADGSALADEPVTVSESNLEVQLYQELAVDERYAVFMVLPRESISYHYERNNADPRVEQSFVLASDQYGNELLSAHVFLARRNQSDPNITVYPEQQAAKATLSISNYVTPLAHDQYCHVSCGQKGIELVNFVQADLEVSVEQPYIDFSKLKPAIDALSLDNPSNIVPYGQAIAPSAGLKARMLSWHRSYFWNDGQTDYLPLQGITIQGLLHHQEEATFTNANLQEAFGDRLIGNNITVEGTSLSQNRSDLVAVTVDNCAIFAGGTAATGASAIVDILDFNDWNGTSTGSIKQLTTTMLNFGGDSKARTAMAATTLTNAFGDWALFGCGINGTTESLRISLLNFKNYNGTISSIPAWTLALSTTLYSLAATTIGTYTIFGGGLHAGVPSNVVDIVTMVNYNPPSSGVSRKSVALSEARYNLAATSVGQCAIFAGGTSVSGLSDRVDIFNLSIWNGTSTITPLTMSLSEPREKLVAVSIGNYAIFAGGMSSSGESNVIDVFDFSNFNGNVTSINCYTLELSIGLSDLAGTRVDNIAVFGGGTSDGIPSNIVNTFDFSNFDGTSDSIIQNVSTLSEARYGLAATNIGSYAIFAGGTSSSGLSNTVDIVPPVSPILQNNGGYIWDSVSGYWWNKGLTRHYYNDSDKFYLPYKTNNTFVSSNSSLYVESTAEYDDYYLHLVATSSYLNTSTTIDTNVEIDYITGGVKRATDANNNISEFLFDPLGQVIVTSRYGTQLDSNDNVVNVGGMGLYNDSTPADKYVPVANPAFDDILADPTKYLQGAGSYYYYNLYAWTTDNQPVSSISLLRRDYYTVKPVIDESDCQIGIVYSDGFGQVLEAKSKDDPGLSFIRLPDGSLKKDGNGNPVEEYSTERWRTSGRTVFNNKNLPVEQYLPYYINSPYYEDQADVPTPPPTKTYYDPLGRTIKAVTPKGFFSKVEFTPWETKHFDENDTVIDSDYVQENYDSLTGYEKTAIDKAILHYNTPSIAIADNRGATFLAVTNNLGNVTAQLFMDNGIDATSAAEIYNYLLGSGYLYTENKTYGTVNKTFSFLTGQFRPYDPDFGFINLPANLLPYNSDMIRILKQNCITEYHELDIQGRNTLSIDPRLYYENLTANTEYYNFKYLYPMNAKSPFYSDSIDAGVEKHLPNIYGQNIFSWTARDYCQITEYDNLQRPVATYVKHIDSPGPITDYSDFDIVTMVTYGENIAGMSETEAKNRNLYGGVYKLNDLSGITLSDSYDITAKAIEVSKQLVEAYQDQIKWNDPSSVVLQSEIYTHSYQYNAINQLLVETTPDSSITSRSYDRSGKLIAISVTYQGNTGDIRPIINDIEYDSNNQRSRVTYANGVITEYSYETTTLRLTNLVSIRTSDNSKVQDIDYYYDPVGNITNLFDRTADTVFYNNQQVSPITTYTYDALYRLLQSNGRVHPNLTKGNTEGDKDSFKNTQFISTTDNTQQLENYTEIYTYDDAGNFIKKQHSATTNSWTTNTDVAANSNRLADLETNGLYDANGNALSLSIGSTTELVYNWKNELRQAIIIARDDAITDDTEYYVYDNGGMRTRRVTRKLVSSVITNIDDKIYFGNYEVKKKIAENQLDPGDDGQYFERHTLRIMDGDKCVAIIYDWVQDDRSQEVDSVPTVKCQYQMGNHLGSVSLELSDSGQLISYEEYFAYGGSAFMAGSNQKEVKVKEYRYSGKERDDTTGLYYYGARYYAPWIGRWMT